MYSYYTDLQGWYGRSGKLIIKYDTEKIMLFIYLSTKQLFDLVEAMTCIIQQHLLYKNVLETFYHVLLGRWSSAINATYIRFYPFIPFIIILSV